MWWAGAGVVVVAAITVVVATLAKSPARPALKAAEPDINNPPATIAVGDYTDPPWPAPTDASAAVAAAGLPMLRREGNVEHIHTHLDVLVNGAPVTVPANIGIDMSRRAISPLHTHDASGVIHIESPVRRPFSLGEFFSEWLVSLSADNTGGLRAGDGKVVRVFVNGAQQGGNPGAIMLRTHDEVAVVYGMARPDETIPSKYDFGNGE
jgi:NAD(P)-dependent dehydrogenase (short-subunit alcohol dehydrogenase family)